MGGEKALFPKQLSAMYPCSEADIRAFTRRAKNPLPCIKSGAKRPFTRIYPSVFATFLLYEQGVAGYAEVEQAARQCVMGVRP